MGASFDLIKSYNIGKIIINSYEDNELYSKVKDYSKERHKVITYFKIGKLLNEAGGKYNNRTLFRMKQFYNMFNNKKVSTLSTQLSRSHYTELY